MYISEHECELSYIEGKLEAAKAGQCEKNRARFRFFIDNRSTRFEVNRRFRWEVHHEQPNDCDLEEYLWNIPRVDSPYSLVDFLYIEVRVKAWHESEEEEMHVEESSSTDEGKLVSFVLRLIAFPFLSISQTFE